MITEESCVFVMMNTRKMYSNLTENLEFWKKNMIEPQSMSYWQQIHTSANVAVFISRVGCVASDLPRRSHTPISLYEKTGGNWRLLEPKVVNMNFLITNYWDMADFVHFTHL
jgi:hypothetical protein